jgi:hypothetical protein
LGDAPVVAVLTSEITRCSINADVFMAGEHMIHRFKLDGIDLKSARLSVDQAIEISSQVFPDPTESPSPFWYQTSSEAELTLNKIVIAFSEK